MDEPEGPRDPWSPKAGDPTASVHTMQCPICEQVLPAPDGSSLREDGICTECAEALGKIPEEPFDESDAELRAAVARYLKRKAYMARYNERPDVREARRGYNKRRQERDRELI